MKEKEKDKHKKVITIVMGLNPYILASSDCSQVAKMDCFNKVMQLELVMHFKLNYNLM